MSKVQFVEPFAGQSIELILFRLTLILLALWILFSVISATLNYEQPSEKIDPRATACGPGVLATANNQ